MILKHYFLLNAESFEIIVKEVKRVTSRQKWISGIEGCLGYQVGDEARAVHLILPEAVASKKTAPR
jgi:hypothetical protein